ncbi:hypothetical protein M3A74_04930 [Corynebacterium appendicis]|uniref:AMIN-like domain-containing (lipo)protein n=1 Tax=Corynebacterium appendicis TaxID=163202 RepID=UPI00223B5321|nr:hypothetical protein [Corynebacterium appendicis]MCT1684159.1 hypothetical protein [Corynebacterium appendicis]
MSKFALSPNPRFSGGAGSTRAAAAVSVAALAVATLSGCGTVGEGGVVQSGAEPAGADSVVAGQTEELQAGKTLNEAGSLSGNGKDRSGRDRGRDSDSDVKLASEKGHLDAANESPKTTRPSAPSRLAVTGLEVEEHDGFDRVIVSLDGDGEPGWFVDYSSSPVQQTAGAPLDVKGSAFLKVNIDGTVYPQDIGRNDVEANHAEGSGSVVEVLNAGTSAGRSQIVIGLKKTAPYTVQTVYNPTRLAIDIARS